MISTDLNTKNQEVPLGSGKLQPFPRRYVAAQWRRTPASLSERKTAGKYLEGEVIIDFCINSIF